MRQSPLKRQELATIHRRLTSTANDRQPPNKKALRVAEGLFYF
jgi:hypothetical protein